MEKRELSEQDEVTSSWRLEAEYHRNKTAPVRHQGGVMTEEQYELLRRQIAAFAALSEMLVDTYNSLLRQHQSFPTSFHQRIGKLE
ncbi:WUSCHEL-related homeobox 14 [Acorus gramineus]|uniref:WUSCHEL-related homeobox 14 n=1 Tax=Acorus gramineus TaxID=55184 RepID=A0AAV9AXI4_ACOGR|nr:WUSCHEL-related homeobox 14 [Acorus gramineus]